MELTVHRLPVKGWRENPGSNLCARVMGVAKGEVRTGTPPG